MTNSVGDTAIIPEGPFVGASLTLHENGHWHFSSPGSVLEQHPWAMTNCARTKEGVVLGSYHRYDGFKADNTLQAKELLGIEFRCANCGINAGAAWRGAQGGAILYHINGLLFTDTAVGPLCPICLATYRELQALEAHGFLEEDEDEEAGAAVPADVLAALPRRTSSLDDDPCPVCLSGHATPTRSTPALVLVKLPCGHKVCEPCITTWFNRANTCPVCRSPVQHNATQPDEAPAPPGP